MSKDNPEEIEIIWVRFNDDNVGKLLREDNRALLKYHTPDDRLAVPIRKQKKTFSMTGSINWLREQFPLTVCYAVTSHKSQGQTLEEVLIDFSAPIKNYTSGAFYTAMSRVRFGANLFLKDFKPEYISANKSVELKLNAMKMSQPYNFKKVLLDSKIFAQPDEEMKIGYININSLLTGQSSTFLNNDHNLLNLDILIVADTRLQQDTSDDHLTDLLSNWNILKRYDAKDDMKHMGLLLLSSKKSQKNNLIRGYYKKHWLKKIGDKNTIFAQLMVIQMYDKKEFGFMYIRETPTVKDVQGFVKDIKDLDVLAGDLNLDPERDDDMKKLIMLLANNKIRALNEITTSRFNQLDHILLKKDLYKEYFCTSFLNYTSDHKVITMRLPIHSNLFSDSFKERVSFEKDHWTRKIPNIAKPVEKIHTKTSNAPNDLKESIDPYIELLNKHNSKKIILHMPDFDQLPNEYFVTLPSNLKDIQIVKSAHVYLLTKKSENYFVLHWTSEYLTLISLSSSDDLGTFQAGQNILKLVKSEYIDKLYNSFSEDFPVLKFDVKTIPSSKEDILHILTLLKHEVYGVPFNPEDLNLVKQKVDIFSEIKSHKLFPLSKKRKQQQQLNNTSNITNKKARKTFRTFANPDMETCWLNSCMQQMLTLLDYSDPITVEDKSELLQMLLSLKNRGGVSLNPLPIRDLLIKTERKRIIEKNVTPDARLFHFNGTTFTDMKKLEKLSEASQIGQQDCQDFFICLKENKNQWQDVVNLFEISTATKTVCQSCGGVSKGIPVNQYYLQLECPIQNMSLNTLINETDTRDWRHEDGCGAITKGRYYEEIQNIETIKFLIIIVRRLCPAPGRRMRIMNTKIDVDQEIDIKSSSGRYVKFKPISIIHHKGYISGNDTRGHYMNDVLDVETNQWIRTSDNEKPQHISRITDQGYIYLLTRI